MGRGGGGWLGKLLYVKTNIGFLVFGFFEGEGWRGGEG